MYDDSACASEWPVPRKAEPDVRHILEDKKQRLEAELADVKAALEGLTANPEFERMFNLLTRTVRL